MELPTLPLSESQSDLSQVPLLLTQGREPRFSDLFPIRGAAIDLELANGMFLQPGDLVACVHLVIALFLPLGTVPVATLRRATAVVCA